MNQAPREDRSRIDWAAVLAGAAAAVTVAVLLSTLGAGGTLVGAALGSVVATVSTALYKQGIQSSRRKVAEVQASALQRVGLAQEEVRRAAARSDSPTVASDLARADAHLEGASSDLADPAEQDLGAAPEPTPVGPEPEPEPERPAWRRVALLTAAVFVVAMVAISGFEVLAGRSLASLLNGTDHQRTSVTGLFGDTAGGSHRSPSPVATVTVTTTTSSTSAPPTPTSAPTTVPTPAPTTSLPPVVTATDTALPSPTAVATDTGTPAP